MKKLLVALLAVVMVLSVAAFNTAEATDTVAMVFPGVITDLAFNQFTYEGMARAKEEGKIQDFAYVENVAQDEQVEYIRQFAAEGYEVVIGQGGQFGDALATVAEEFPDGSANRTPSVVFLSVDCRDRISFRFHQQPDLCDLRLGAF